LSISSEIPFSLVKSVRSFSRTAELLIAKGDPVGATAALQPLLEEVGKDPSLVALRIRAMVLNAEAQAAGGTAPATPISMLSAALALARHHYLDLHAGLVACHIANLQVRQKLSSLSRTVIA